MLERFQGLKERAWCTFWRWQYLFVVRCFPHVRDEIWQGGYDEGFSRGQDWALDGAAEYETRQMGA